METYEINGAENAIPNPNLIIGASQSSERKKVIVKLQGGVCTVMKIE